MAEVYLFELVQEVLATLLPANDRNKPTMSGDWSKYTNVTGNARVSCGKGASYQCNLSGQLLRIDGPSQTDPDINPARTAIETALATRQNGTPRPPPAGNVWTVLMTRTGLALSACPQNGPPCYDPRDYGCDEESLTTV